jgi:hypothetical protein
MKVSEEGSNVLLKMATRGDVSATIEPDKVAYGFAKLTISCIRGNGQSMSRVDKVRMAQVHRSVDLHRRTYSAFEPFAGAWAAASVERSGSMKLSNRPK